MKRLSFAASTLALLLTAPVPARADGFTYSEHGACASGLAGAFIARACPNDPSSLFHNPAAITLVTGTRMALGGTLLLNASDYRYELSPGSAVTIGDENETFFPFHLYVTHALTPRVSVGFALFSPYGLGTEWPASQENVGRFVAYNTEILTFYAQPTVAVRLSPEISVGGGLEIAYTQADLDRLVDAQEFVASYPPLTYSAADAHLEADGWSVGFVASVMIEPSDAVSFGLRYLSQTTVKLKGDVTLVQTSLEDQGAPNGDVADAVIGASLPTQPVPGNTELTLPDQIIAVIELRPFERWTFGLGYVWTNWSDFDTLVIRVEGEAPDTLAPNFGNSSMFRLGTAYELSPRVTLRAGYIHDPTPADPADPFGVDVILPDATRNDLSLGIGWQAAPRVRLDAYWLGVFFNETPGCVVPTPGSCVVPAQRFHTTAHLIGTTLSYAF